MHTVYLAGPISGLNYDGATGWRELAEATLARAGIKALSPMRAKEYLKGVPEFSHTEDYGHLGPMSGDRAVMTRDRFDATRCDVLLVNFLGAERVSIGTVMEIAWADLSRIPVVLITEPDRSNVHEHSMINEAVGFRAATLAEGLAIVKAILS